MKILVTGGAGFIGSHIVNAYIDGGHDVIIIDNLSSGEMKLINPKAKFYHLDIHSPEVKTILEKEKITVINHHAAQISVSASVSDPLFDANSNIIGTLQLLQNAVLLMLKNLYSLQREGQCMGNKKPFPQAKSIHASL